MPLQVSCRSDDSEKHEFDVNSILYHKGKLYSAGDDGRIKAWSPDLKLLAQAQAHPCSVYCLAASDDALYSCSNEGTVKAWDLVSLKEKKTVIKCEEREYWVVRYSAGVLYTGDDQGNVLIHKDGKNYGMINVAEPVKDLIVSKNLLYSGKDNDIVITEVNLGSEKPQFGTRATIQGRAPITVVDDRLIFSSREGKDLLLHEATTPFKELGQAKCYVRPILEYAGPVWSVQLIRNQNMLESVQRRATRLPFGRHRPCYEERLQLCGLPLFPERGVEGAHEMIINALSSVKCNGNTVVFSGGWDKVVKQWKIENDGLKVDSVCNVDIVINALAVGEKGELYAAGGDGHIVRVTG